MADFLESPRFPESIAYGFQRTPKFNTQVTRTYGGKRITNANWSAPLHQYTFNPATNTLADALTIRGYFYATLGAAGGFRFKDPSDYQLTHSTGVLGAGNSYGVGNGGRTYQMFQKLGLGSAIAYRKISKPVSATAEIKRGGSVVTPTIDYTTGQVTFSVTGKVITGITKAADAQVTSTAHGFTTGDKVEIAGVNGMTQINGLIATVTVVDANHFTTGINSTAFSTWTWGGYAYKGPQSSETLTVAGEFDVPVAFTEDNLDQVIANWDYMTTGITIEELRL